MEEEDMEETREGEEELEQQQEQEKTFGDSFESNFDDVKLAQKDNLVANLCDFSSENLPSLNNGDVADESFQPQSMETPLDPTPNANVPKDDGPPSENTDVHNFKFRHSADGYHYYEDDAGSWYAQDDAGYWYYQESDGNFKLWDSQNNSYATADDAKKSELLPDTTQSFTTYGNVAENLNVDEVNKQNFGDSTMMVENLDNVITEPIVSVDDDGRPQYPRGSDGKFLLPVGPDGKKVSCSFVFCFFLRFCIICFLFCFFRCFLWEKITNRCSPSTKLVIRCFPSATMVNRCFQSVQITDRSFQSTET